MAIKVNLPRGYCFRFEVFTVANHLIFIVSHLNTTKEKRMDNLCEICNEKIGVTGVRDVILCQDCFDKISTSTDSDLFTKFNLLAEARKPTEQLKSRLFDNSISNMVIKPKGFKERLVRGIILVFPVFWISNFVVGIFLFAGSAYRKFMSEGAYTDLEKAFWEKVPIDAIIVWVRSSVRKFFNASMNGIPLDTIAFYSLLIAFLFFISSIVIKE